ncbi:hypothetical protein ACGFRG_05390 [Streptomyces sp. NPDC048696]|uniref:hypothetical protein n=1 Tax=Streptomyces sp. NPDC048696 TaxID=3365585 RepID=UPI00372089D7
MRVEHIGLCLQDANDTRLPAMFHDGYEPGPFLTARKGRLDITSAGHTHYAHFTVEVGDNQLYAPEGDWEEEALASIFCAAGQLYVRSLMGGPATDMVRLSEGPAT